MFNKLNQDAKKIRNSVIIFCLGFLIRLILSTAFSWSQVRKLGIDFTERHITYFALCQLLAWAITELWPILYLLLMHYKNLRVSDYDNESSNDEHLSGQLMNLTVRDPFSPTHSSAQESELNFPSNNYFLELLDQNNSDDPESINGDFKSSRGME